MSPFSLARSLCRLRRRERYDYCLEATVWFDVKPGYLGAYLNDGFAPPALPALVAELRAALPRVVGALPLVNAWAYKYGGHGDADAGIRPHADNARVNLNLWLTPDEFHEPAPRAANGTGRGGGGGGAAAARDARDDEEDASALEYPGGLTVYGCEAPNEEAGLRDWNDFTEEARIRAWIDDPSRPCLARARRVRYRRNRAVIFDSDLLHETARYRFGGGYRGRRINLTLLFGSRD